MASRSRRFVAVTAAGLVVVLAAGAVGPAGADPVPDSPTAALDRLAELSRTSEQTAEAMHNAQIDLDSKLAVQRDAESRHDQDVRRLDEARARMAQFQPAVDRLTLANYQGGRINRLFAVMVSDSPQQLLDQMSTLNVLAADTAARVGKFKEAGDEASAAEEASRTSSDQARTATEHARSISDDLQRTQSDLQTQINQVTQVFATLTSAQKATLAGSSFPPGYDPATVLKGLVPGSNTSALEAALTQVGKPYEWGATGPEGYDCSGLMVWAYGRSGRCCRGRVRRRRPAELRCASRTSSPATWSSTTRMPPTWACTPETGTSCTPPPSASRSRSPRWTPTRSTAPAGTDTSTSVQGRAGGDVRSGSGRRLRSPDCSSPSSARPA